MSALAKGSDGLGDLLFILENSCHQLRSTSAHGIFLITKILSSRTKLQRRCRPVSEQDKLF